MSIDDFRADARVMIERLLLESAGQTDRDALIQTYVDQLSAMHRHYAHQLLSEVINDARTRLDARLSPDPIRQTIATVQTTVQDVWKSLWQ